MPHPLKIAITTLRRRARRLLWLHGLCWTAAWTIAAAALMALGDYLVHYEDRGIRLAVSLVAAAVFGWACYRFLFPVLSARLSDVFLARQIERKHPLLRERLSGAVAFLGEPEDDPRAGSPALRKLMIHETTQDAVRLPLTDVLHVRPVLAAVGVAAVVGAIVGAVAIARPDAAKTALLRLLMPWGDDAWPQVNHLKFVDPVHRLALGRRFHAEVVDAHGAEIEGDVRLEFRFGGDGGTVEHAVMHPDGGVWTADRDGLDRDFAYRAVGGDDRSMPWIEAQVVEPPSLTEIRWRVRYPDYCRWSPLDTGMQPGDRRPLTAAIPIGSRLELWARTNKPLRSAALVTDSGLSLAATLDADHRGFTLSSAAGNAWEAGKSEFFRFQVTGEDGFEGGDETRQELTVEPDPPPWAKLERPRGTPEDPRGDIFVTPSAVVTAAVEAGDVFPVRPGVALSAVSLRYGRSDRSAEGDATIALYEGPKTLEPSTAPAPATLRDEETRTIEYRWNLEPLTLAPGTFLTVYAVARDYKGQERISESRRLRVVGSTEFVERLNERQRALHAELNKLRDKQDEARRLAAEAAAKSRDEKAPADTIRNDLTQALDLQRQVAAGLGLARNERSEARPDGVRNRVARMLDDLRTNRVDDRQIESRLATIDETLAEAERTGKPQAAVDQLAEAQKNDPADPNERRQAAEALAKADERQAEVRDALDAMLRNLAQWDGYGKFHEELNRLRRDQERLAGETLEHLQKQLRDVGDPQESAKRAAELAAEQTALSRRFEALRQQMRRSRDEGDAQAAEALGRAVEAAERENPAEAMREAGRMLEQNRGGSVAARQQEALEKLGRVMQALSATKADELNRLVAKLRESQRDLKKLTDEQRGLKKKLDEAAANPDEAARKQELLRLARQQRELQKRAEEMAERLRRLQAKRPASRMERGGARMSGASQGAEQGDAAEAGEQAEAAARDLENAERELAEERRQAEADLAREAAAKLADDLKASIVRQERVIADTERYEALRKSNQLTRAALIGLLDLAREQESLAAEAKALAERLASAAAFKLALEGAAAEMTRAADLLRERETGAPAQRAEQNALRRYKQLAEAFKPPTGKNGQAGGQGGGGGAGGGGRQGGDGQMHDLAELVLVKLMQEDVNDRTKQLDALRQKGELTPEQRREFELLGEEQGKLADLLLELVGETPEPDAEAPMPDDKPGAETKRSDGKGDEL